MCPKVLPDNVSRQFVRGDKDEACSACLWGEKYKHDAGCKKGERKAPRPHQPFHYDVEEE
jgi:hypothetical protein